MTNGQEKARENLVAFQRWAATKTDDDLKQIVFRGRLNRGESPLAARGQSPQLKSRLRPFFDKKRTFFVAEIPGD